MSKLKNIDKYLQITNGYKALVIIISIMILIILVNTIKIDKTTSILITYALYISAWILVFKFFFIDKMMIKLFLILQLLYNILFIFIMGINTISFTIPNVILPLIFILSFLTHNKFNFKKIDDEIQKKIKNGEKIC